MKNVLKKALKAATVLAMALMIVTVHAAPSGVAEVKWLEGEHTAADFAGAGTVITDPYSFEVPGNGKYTIYARDVAGNESVKVVEVTSVDTIAPVVELSAPNTPTNADVTVTVNASDAESGLLSVKWLPGNVPAEDFASAGNALSEPYTFTVSEDGIYTVCAEDNVGNKTVQTIEITCIDKDAPVIDATVPSDWTGGSVTINVTVTD